MWCVSGLRPFITNKCTFYLLRTVVKTTHEQATRLVQTCTGQALMGRRPFLGDSPGDSTQYSRSATKSTVANLYYCGLFLTMWKVWMKGREKQKKNNSYAKQIRCVFVLSICVFLSAQTTHVGLTWYEVLLCYDEPKVIKSRWHLITDTPTFDLERAYRSLTLTLTLTFDKRQWWLKFAAARICFLCSCQVYSC